MKKKTINILMLLAVMATAFQVTSCSDDDFTATIFDTNDYPLDRNLYTFPLDTFVKVNFLEPYNMRFVYKMEYIASDKDKNLTPATYDKSCQLAVLTKYLWHDVYKEVADEHDVFLKKFSPRIIHVIGSKNLNTSSGTETLGVTEGNTKVTLYRTNLLNPDDIADMNEYFFETMHHEFGHILDNNTLHPTPFNLLSNGRYNAAGWNDTPDSVAAAQGFISSYASMSYTEDWVETFARYVTRDSVSLERMFNTADYEWEVVDLKDKNNDLEVDSADYFSQLTGTFDIDTIGYFKGDESGKGEHKVYRRVCQRDADDHVVLDANGQVQWVANLAGARDIINEKIKYVRDYMKTEYGVDIDELRRKIQTKQFRVDDNGKYLTKVSPVLAYSGGAVYVLRQNEVQLNAITYRDPLTGKTQLEQLLEELYEYKKLQTK